MTNRYDLNADDWRKLGSQWDEAGYSEEADVCQRAAASVSQARYVVLCAKRDEGASWGVSRKLDLSQCSPVSNIQECQKMLKKQPYLVVRLDSWREVSKPTKTAVEDFISNETVWLNVDGALDLQRLSKTLQS